MKFRLLLTAALLTSASLSAQTLIHAYDFSGGTVTDLVGSANATLMNGATVSNGHLALDGVNDYAIFDTQIVPTGGTAFTVMISAQADGPLNLVGHHALLGQGNYGSPAGFFIGYHTDNGHMRAGDSWEDIGVPYPTDGLWHSYVVTYEGTTTSFYLDGTIVGSHQYANPIASADSANTVLGAAIYGGNEYFKGSIANVQIYNGAMSASQVAAAVPEPATTALAAAGLALGVVLLRRRRAVAA
ncbi:MAG: LamG domain-containing protein [Verrucomicrobia bacterium]|nr:LamG domain-containing protein [Verrucomicrobiota bacterium]